MTAMFSRRANRSEAADLTNEGYAGGHVKWATVDVGYKREEYGGRGSARWDGYAGSSRQGRA